MNKGVVLLAFISISILLFQCTGTTTNTGAPAIAAITIPGGFGSQVEWGQHLVTVSGCQDCHSSKKMASDGPQIDSSVMLAGYMGGSPENDVDRKDAQAKGLAVTRNLTAWVGPWGVSYSANLTSDATGIGNWTEERFILALREGKSKGLANSRSLLPPMPWRMFRHFTDDEIKAIFAFLKSTKPVHNIVPPPVPPAN